MRIRNLRSAWYWMAAGVAVLVCVISLASIVWLRTYSRYRSQQLFEKSAAQFQLKVETYLEDFRRVAKHASYYKEVQSYLFSGSELERMKSGKLAMEQAGRLLESHPAVKDIVFLTDDHVIYDVRGYYGRKLYQTLEIGGKTSAFSLKQPFFQYVDPAVAEEGHGNTAYFQYVFPVYSLLPGEFSSSNSAVCVLLGNLNDIPNFKEDFDISYDSFMILEEGQAIYSDQTGKEGTLEDIDALPVGWSQTEYEGSHMLTFRTELKDTNWDTVFLAKDQVFLADFYPIQVFLVVLLLFSLASMFLIMLWAIHSISVPIKRLKTDLEKVRVCSENGATNFLEASDIEEMNWIRKSINAMIARVEEEQSRQYQIEEELYQATISAKQSLLQYYQSQINPHFLYNSLECIRSIAQLCGIGEISEISIALANLFRYSIDERSEVSLETELHNVQDYFDVISIRKPGQFEMRVQCSEEVRRLPVKKMILQPVVENAIEHGFQEKPPPYIISVRCEICSDGLLHIVVADNGSGISEERIREIQESFEQQEKNEKEFSSIGLKNLYNRLMLSYEGKGKVQLSSKEGYFTRVELILPAEPGKGRGRANETVI